MLIWHEPLLWLCRGWTSLSVNRRTQGFRDRFKLHLDFMMLRVVMSSCCGQRGNILDSIEHRLDSILDPCGRNTLNRGPHVTKCIVGDAAFAFPFQKTFPDLQDRDDEFPSEADRFFKTESLFASTQFSVEGQQMLEWNGTRFIEYNSFHERQKEVVQPLQGECMYLGKVPFSRRGQRENFTPS